MNTTDSHKVQREVLRLRLQVQREQLSRKFKPRPAGSGSPRSLTMRLLTRQPSLGLWVLAEFLPVLLRHFFGGYNRDTTFSDIEDDQDEEVFLPRQRHTKRTNR